MEIDIEKKIERLLQMSNIVSELQNNTQDAEMSKYFMGFKEGIDWVITVALRNERISEKLIVKTMENHSE